MKLSPKELLRQSPALHGRLRAAKNRYHTLRMTRLEHLIAGDPKSEILVVFGMRRSGNHLAITWMLEQMQAPAVFYNNINPATHPYSAKMTEYRAPLGTNGTGIPRILLSYEDLTTSEIEQDPLTGYLEGIAPDRIRSALILRDPYNLFASRLRKWPERFGSADAIQAQVNLYLAHATLAQNPAPVWGSRPVIPVLYNRLISEPDYRAKTAAALGIFDGTKGMDRVPVYGHGSSFEGVTGQGADMGAKTTARWEAMRGEATFEAIIARPELQGLSQSLFGIAPPK